MYHPQALKLLNNKLKHRTSYINTSSSMCVVTSCISTPCTFLSQVFVNHAAKKKERTKEAIYHLNTEG